MESFEFLFSNLTLFDIIDILLVAVLIYLFFNLIKGTIAVNIFIGLICVYLVYLMVKSLNMQLLTNIFDKIAGVGVIALIIVFQQEIRRFLLLIGKNLKVNRNRTWFRYFFNKTELKEAQLAQLRPILDACKNMKKHRVGALIVIAKDFEEQIYFNNGEEINAEVSKRLLEAIFSKTSPLHDGAVVIADNKIKSASCILPLTDNTELPAQMGLRHRAGIGITENTDAIAIIVSEETGEIAYAKQGKVRANISLTELERYLNKDLN